MFYKTKLREHIRVPPKLFDLPTEQAVLEMLRQGFEGFIDKDLGIMVGVLSVDDIKEGSIIPGDGASYYESTFNLLMFKPELQEVLPGRIRDIADFGAFISIGPIDGMIHISQTMDDFVSFGKDKVLLGKDTKRSLKVNDPCRARIIATSFKELTNPKIGLTMRQKGLGKTDWVEEDISGKKKAEKPEGSGQKGKKKDKK